MVWVALNTVQDHYYYNFYGIINGQKQVNVLLLRNISVHVNILGL